MTTGTAFFAAARATLDMKTFIVRILKLSENGNDGTINGDPSVHLRINYENPLANNSSDVESVATFIATFIDCNANDYYLYYKFKSTRMTRGLFLVG